MTSDNEADCEGQADETKLARPSKQQSKPDTANLMLPEITRRTLLASGAAIVAAAPVLADDRDEGELHVNVIDNGGGARVALGGTTIDIRTSAFGPDAILKVINQKGANTKSINIKKASFAVPSNGKPAFFEFSLNFKKEGGRWSFSFGMQEPGAAGLSSGRIGWKGFATTRIGSAKFASEGKAPPDLISLPRCKNLSSETLAGLLDRLVTVSGGRLDLALSPDMTFYMMAGSKNEKYTHPLKAVGHQIEFSCIRFGWANKTTGPLSEENIRIAERGAPIFALVGFDARHAQATETIVKHDSGNVVIRHDGRRKPRFALQQWRADKRAPAKTTVAVRITRWSRIEVLRNTPGTPIQSRRPTTLPFGWSKTIVQHSPDGSRRRLDEVYPAKGTPFDILSSVARISVAPIDLGTYASPLRVKSRNGILINFELKLKFLQAYRSAKGADYTLIKGGNTNVLLKHAAYQDEQDKKAPAFIAIGRKEKARLNLDQAHVHLRRSSDLLDLTFAFKGVDLVISDNRAMLQPRPDVKPEDARMVVGLPPQHVAEEAFLLSEHLKVDLKRHEGIPIAKISDEGTRKFFEREFPDEKVVPKLDPTKYSLAPIAQARLGGRSRVAFMFKSSSIASIIRLRPDIDAGGSTCQDRSPTSIEFSVAGLTEFARFTPAVVPRARHFEPDKTDPDAEAAARLDFYGLKPNRNWHQRLDEIRNLMQPPDAFQTAIELPYRLILSPDDTATWLASPDPDPKPCGVATTAVWRMELVQAETTKNKLRQGVRAIASPDFDPDMIGMGQSRKNTPVDPATQFRAALNAYDRHEIVALSSMQGLPVLRRATTDGKAAESQVSPPEGYRLIDRAQGAGNNDAIYVPKPLQVSELKLSALGGSISLEGYFEPPTGLGSDGTPKTAPEDLAYSVERWRHVTALGRDVAVEVVYKGFLYPIGHRCSLVKLTTREFVPHPRGHMAAYLIQRLFLRIADPKKLFPAYSQPDCGRRFPAREIEILTKRTPDLSDILATEPTIQDDAGAHVALGGRITKIGDEPVSGVVAWPRTMRAGAREVPFELQIDGDPKSVATPFIFVDNVAANSTKTLALLHGYYDRLGRDRDPRVIVQHGNVPRRYAEETKVGETTFETVEWTLASDSKISSTTKSAESDDLAFGFDPLMNGADQPPFFPALRSARIRVKQIERLSGAAAPVIDVAYFDQFLSDGFMGQNSQPQMYLRATGPKDQRATVNFDQAGDRAGGVGKPNAEVVAFSREFGPVAPGRTRAAADGLVELDLSSFTEFDPKSFFPDAKLLGVIKFADLLQEVFDEFTAPRLKQVVQYALQSDGKPETACAELRKFASRTQEFVAKERQQIEGRLAKVRSVFGTLFDSIDLFEVRLGKLANAKECNDVIKLYGEVGEVYESGRHLLHVLKGVAANPGRLLTDAAREQLDRLSGAATAAVGLTELRDSYLEHEAKIKRAGDQLRADLDELLAGPLDAAFRRYMFAVPSDGTEPLTNAGIDAETFIDTALRRALKGKAQKLDAAGLVALRHDFIVELDKALDAEIAAKEATISKEALAALVAFKSDLNAWVKELKGLAFNAIAPAILNLANFASNEPPRDCRRLQLLRDWSHVEPDQIPEVLAGGA